MIIAFDFDGCLDDKRLKILAKKMVHEGNEIWIVTARSENEFNKEKISPVLKELMVSEYQVIYANGKQKWELIQGLNADIYIDNITSEFQNIMNYTNTVALLFSK